MYLGVWLVSRTKSGDKQGMARCVQSIMTNMQVHIGEILKDRNIILKGADAATAKGFTQVPNFLLKSNKLSAGDKMTFAMLLSYAWKNDFCFPGQERLAQDMGLSDRSV